MLEGIRVLEITAPYYGDHLRQQFPPSSRSLPPGLPVTRVNSSNYPAITSHLSDDWMRRHEDRTKVPQAIRKGQVDSELVKRFRVVWWSKVRIYTVQLKEPGTGRPATA